MASSAAASASARPDTGNVSHDVMLLEPDMRVCPSATARVNVALDARASSPVMTNEASAEWVLRASSCAVVGAPLMVMA